MNVTANWMLENGIKEILDGMKSYLVYNYKNCDFLIEGFLREFTGNLISTDEALIDEINPYDVELTADQRAELKRIRKQFLISYKDDYYKHLDMIITYMVKLLAKKENIPENSPICQDWIKSIQEAVRDYRKALEQSREKAKFEKEEC